MKLRSFTLGIVILVVIFGSVFLADALGYWNTENLAQPVKFESGEYAGEFNPADIRGSYSFGDIENTFHIDASILAQAFEVAESQANAFQVKSLETIYESLAASGVEIGTNSVKYFVSLYTGLPFESTETIYLPTPAVEILIAKGKVSTEAAASLQEITVDIADFTNTSSNVTGAIPKGTETTTGFVIKGSTTFREILDTGISQKEIESVTGKALPNPLIVIKTYCTERQLDFETVKISLQALVDSK
ncbi:MAG TPA: hypothetical protein VFF80_04345 [Bacillota bacterium]|nr:hypothetical protein [Bacillota bacterium]